MSIRDNIAKSLLYYRKQSGMTQKELAEKLGVKNTAVSNWEKGSNSIDIETLFTACEIFGVTINDMYGIPAQPTSISPIEKLYNQLDDTDRAKAESYIQGLLSSEKYEMKEKEAYA